MPNQIDLSDLANLIVRIAGEKGIQPEDLVSELTEILKMKYGITLHEKERAIIDVVRTKIITRLYNTEGHAIDRRSIDAIRHYRLDELEGGYLELAENELLSEGLLERDGRRLRLSQPGILKYKEFYGEI
jgi:hypothetical protein